MGEDEEGTIRTLNAYKEVMTGLIQHHRDREKEARAEAAEVLRIDPKFSLEDYVRLFPFKSQKAIDNYIEPLRKLGLK